jgi:hypothetical protein
VGSKEAEMVAVFEDKRGRPPGRNFAETIPVRLSRPMMEKVDDWADANQASRSEAIRRLIELD